MTGRVLGEFGQDESIDGVSDIRDWWRRLFCKRFERPPVERVGFVVAGPWRALIDPGAKHADLLACEAFAFLGHEAIRIRAGDKLDEQAFRALAWDDGGSAVATFQGGGLSIQTELVLLLVRTVALVAAFLENRLEILLKIDGSRGGWRQVGGMCSDKRNEHDQGTRKPYSLTRLHHSG
jgi:hypothetical protein